MPKKKQNRVHSIKRYGWVPDLPDARDHMYAAPMEVMARALSARLESQGIPSESRMGESPSVVPSHRFAFWGANAEAVFAGLAWTGD